MSLKSYSIFMYVAIGLFAVGLSLFALGAIFG